MRELIRKLMKQNEVAPVSYVAQHIIDSVTPSSSDVELEEGTKVLENSIQMFFDVDQQRRVSRPLSTEDWAELTQLTTLRTAAQVERKRRDTYLY